MVTKRAIKIKSKRGGRREGQCGERNDEGDSGYPEFRAYLEQLADSYQWLELQGIRAAGPPRSSWARSSLP